MFLGLNDNPPGQRGINMEDVLWYLDFGSSGIEVQVLSTAYDLANGSNDKARFLDALKQHSLISLPNGSTPIYLVASKIVDYNANSATLVQVNFAGGRSYQITNSTDRATFLAYMAAISK